MEISRTALLLVSHGGVESLGDLPDFLSKIRRERGVPASLFEEVKRRYELVGGQSPLNAITRQIGQKLESRLHLPVRVAFRFVPPHSEEQLIHMKKDGYRHVVVLPLAPYSAVLYSQEVKRVAELIASRGDGKIHVDGVTNWGDEPALIHAFARSLTLALNELEKSIRRQTTVIMTAHSLPLHVLRDGDPYADQVRSTAVRVAASLGERCPPWELAFQSQGFQDESEQPVRWLGPSLESVIQASAQRGSRHVLIAPIGFLSDHVEILYDIDHEARNIAHSLGLSLSRTASLNASELLLQALENIVYPFLDSGEQKKK
ncbi:ferrochelatase [Pajaroellobacter abortibovis]|uniref:Ferrochelatase n=1 Tax=Pajaroellobacter abortibovis TaxID=1882918 RepID=A0A1L6MXN5_9BACT|nr:ferrochelatase [Pajaroellobacter abortibovis]APS00257.1 ferrochelatase [Pajaroellobacter abortibovis]